MPSRKSSAPEQLGLDWPEPPARVPGGCAASPVPALVAGVDEAGRGPLAGPVVAAAVILDELQPGAGPGRFEDAHACTARAAVRRDLRQGAVREHRRGQRRGDRQPEHPAGHAAGHAARRARACAWRRSRCSSTAIGSRRCRCRRRPSSGATPRWPRSRRRRSWPRCIATASARNCTRGFPAMASTATRVTPRPSTWPRCSATARARRTAAALRRSAWRWTGPGRRRLTEPLRITSRDNPLLQRLRRLAQDGSAYRRLGQVWLEGEHLCSALRERGGSAAQAVISEEAWHDPRLRELAGWAAKARGGAVAAVCRPERAGVAGSHRLRPRPAAAGARAGRRAQRGARPPAGPRQRRQRAAQRGGFRRARRCWRSKAPSPCGRPRCCVPAWVRTSGCNWPRGWKSTRWPPCSCRWWPPVPTPELDLPRATLPWPCAWVLGHEGQGVAAALVDALRAAGAHPAAGRRGVAQRRRRGSGVPVRIGAAAHRSLIRIRDPSTSRATSDAGPFRKRVADRPHARRPPRTDSAAASSAP